MEANRPIAASPSPSSKGVAAKPVAIAAAPVPRKNTAIMPGTLQRSPSQPAGTAPTPNSTWPTSIRAISSSNGRFQAISSDSTTVGYSSISRCAKVCPAQEKPSARRAEV